ncbi:MAG: hypothetical protein ACK5HY_09735, partial [Parahaliea sp.]
REEGEAQEQSTQADASQSEQSPLVFPVSVEVSRLAVSAAEVLWPGGGWHQGPMQLALKIEGSGVHISDAAVQQPRLILAASEPDSVPERVQLPALWLPLELRVEPLELVGPAWEFGGSGDALERLALHLRWQGDRLVISDVQAARPGWGSASLKGELRFAGDWPLQLAASAEVDENLPAIATLRPGALQLVASGSLAQLALELSSAGDSALSLQGRLDALAPELPFDLQSRVTRAAPLALGALVDGLSPELAALQLHSPLALSASGSLDRLRFTLGGGASGLGYGDMQIDLAGELAGQHLALESLTVRETGADGSALAATGTLELDATKTLALRLQTPGLELPRIGEGGPSGRLRGELAVIARLSGEQWRASLEQIDLQGEVNGVPDRAIGSLRLDSAHYLAGGDLEFDINGASGTLKDAADGGSVVKLAVPDLGRWRSGGRGQIEARADWHPGKESLQLQASASGINWQDLSVDDASLRGSISLAGDPGGNIHLEFGHLRSGEMALEAGELALVGDAGSLSFNLRSSGDIEGMMEASARRQGERWTGSLEPASLSTPLGVWTLEEAVAMHWQDGQTVIAPHCWRSEASALCLRQADIGRRGEFALDLENGAALLSLLALKGVSIAGALGGEVKANWTAEQPLSATLALHFDQGTVTQQLKHSYASWSWEQFRVDGQYRDGALQLTASLQRDQRRVLSLEVALPAKSGGELTGTGRLDNLQLNALLPFLPALRRLAGALQGVFRREGSPGAPR